MLGVSYPTIKQWILAGKLKTVTTPGGHHRVSEAALRPLIDKDKQKPQQQSRERYRRVSGRNQMLGRVVSVRIEGLLAQVVIAVEGQQITSIITAEAARELGLRKGEIAAALIKATDVMIERVEQEP